MAIQDIKKIKENINKASETFYKKTGIKQDVKLIAVSKTVDCDLVYKAMDAQQFEFGENRVQELQRKAEIIKDTNIKWHFIGNLQANKIKYLARIDNLCLIHSIDKIKLLDELEKQGTKNDCVFDCLIQINIAGEEQKGGISPCDLSDILDGIEKYNHIKIKGLMNIAPFSATDDELRADFKKMRELFDKESEKNRKNVEMSELSMGMTNDYVLAVEEGATMIRVGRAIFQGN